MVRNAAATDEVTPAEMPQSTRAWLDILDEDDRETFRSKSIEAAKIGARVEAAYRLRRGDGELIHVRQVIEPLEGKSAEQDAFLMMLLLQDLLYCRSSFIREPHIVELSYRFAYIQQRKIAFPVNGRLLHRPTGRANDLLAAIE